jgi:hypothetical protein
MHKALMTKVSMTRQHCRQKNSMSISRRDQVASSAPSSA